MSRFPVFIVGSPRSGTSVLVDAMLSAGYKGYREGNFLSLLFALGQQIDRHFAVFDSAGDRVMIGNVERETLKSDIFDLIYQTTERLNPTAPWFDKSGNAEMIKAIPIIRTLWPESVFVFAMRRGLENVNSRLKKFPGHTFEYHCADWAGNMRAWRDMRAKLADDVFIEVDQQEMIQSPESVGRRLQRLLLLSEGQAGAVASTLTKNRPQETEAGSARRLQSIVSMQWSSQQQNVFFKYCMTEMEAYGYTIDDTYNENLSGVSA